MGPRNMFIVLESSSMACSEFETMVLRDEATEANARLIHLLEFKAHYRRHDFGTIKFCPRTR